LNRPPSVDLCSAVAARVAALDGFHGGGDVASISMLQLALRLPSGEFVDVPVAERARRVLELAGSATSRR
jgi:hypothetical protein